MKKTILSVILVMIVFLLIIGITISVTEEDKEKEKEAELEKQREKGTKSLGDLETKTLSDTEKTKLVTEADTIWKDQLKYTTFEITHYREYNNITIMYVNIDGTPYKWLKGTGDFDKVKK